MKGKNMGMLKLDESFQLLLNADLLRFGLVRIQDFIELDCINPVSTLVQGGPNHSLSTDADLLEQLVLAEELSGRKRIQRGRGGGSDCYHSYDSRGESQVHY